MAVTAHIGLGSNLGDRRATLDHAVAALRSHPAISDFVVSSYWETQPVGGPPGQPPYLNAAAQFMTSLNPESLLRLLLEIEARFGRVRGEPNAPRTLDLDLLLYDDLVRSGPDPVIPHPRMHLRTFVMNPLAEIAPAVRHPVFGVTAARLAENLKLPPPTGLPLAGLRTLVTGSSSGIGQAIAESLAEAGAWVIVHGYRSLERCRAVADSLRRFDVAAEARLADLRNPDQVAALGQSAWNQWHGLDLLVCNAGADTLTGAASRWTFERKLEELWAVDVRSTIQLARDIGSRMKEQGSGLILTLGWDQAETGMEGDSGQLFAAVKNAVLGFTRSLALTLAPEVRVNCLAPGWIRTAWGEGASDDWHERVLRETPLARWGTPQDVATAARWLASPDSRFVTGQVIRVNGGAVR
jgi:2-amino-4-hydroxy-6-hydroxymethyldihydropteridine diphosphokinase